MRPCFRTLAERQQANIDAMPYEPMQHSERLSRVDVSVDVVRDVVVCTNFARKLLHKDFYFLSSKLYFLFLPQRSGIMRQHVGSVTLAIRKLSASTIRSDSALLSLYDDMCELAKLEPKHFKVRCISPESAWLLDAILIQDAAVTKLIKIAALGKITSSQLKEAQSRFAQSYNRLKMLLQDERGDHIREEKAKQAEALKFTKFVMAPSPDILPPPVPPHEAALFRAPTQPK